MHILQSDALPLSSPQDCEINDFLFFYFKLKDEHNIYTNTGQFLTQVFRRTCKISHGRENRMLKIMRQSLIP